MTAPREVSIDPNFRRSSGSVVDENHQTKGGELATAFDKWKKFQPPTGYARYFTLHVSWTWLSYLVPIG